MATAAELSILISAKDTASRVLKDVGGSVGGLQSKIGSLAKTGGLLAAGGLAAGAYAIVGFVKEAAAEQVGIERLQTAIKTLDEAQQGSAASVEKVVRAREKLAFSDGQLRDSLSLLIPATGDYEEAVRRQSIAMDVARGTGLDLATTSRLLGKVSEESINVFKRYGITLKEGMSETEALAAVQAKFAGQAQAYAQTAAGKWEIFNNQIDNIKESIGAALLPTVTELGAALGDFLLRNQDNINRFSQALAEKIPAGIQAIKDGFERMKPVLEPIFTQMKDGFERIRPPLEWIINNKVALTAAVTAIGIAMLLAFTPVTAPILAIVAALTLLTIALGMNQQDWKDLGASVNQAWEDIQAKSEEKLGFLGTIISFAMDSIRNEWVTKFKVLRDIAVVVLAVLQGDWGAAWEGIKQIFIDVWEGIKTDLLLKVAFIRDALSFAWPFISSIAESAWNALRDVAGRVWGEIKDAIIGPIDDVIGKIQDLIDKINDIPSMPDLTPGFDIPKVPGLANGVRTFRGGLALVGERGPELVYLPRGSNVYTNEETRGMPAQRRGEGGGRIGAALTNYGTVQIVLPNVQEPQEFARELDRYFR